MAITPTKEQFTEFAHGRQGGEVVMINLLHFDRSGGPDSGVSGESSGQDAYRDYSAQVIKMVEARGGKLIWTGRPEQVLIGDTDADAWDMVALVSYPSRAAFIDMVTSPSYGEAHADRERGLDRTVLLAREPMTTTLSGGGEGAPVPDSMSNGLGGRKRNILFITTDQQRYDSLGCNGGTVARTPVVDRLAAEGINYRRAYNQNTVCMPARSTILTGQYVRTHGVVANGIPLPTDAPSIAQYLHDKAGYRTALLGKAHFEPNFDPQRQFEENARVARGDIGPWRGFERSEQALHAAAFRGHPIAHYGRWLKKNHPEHLESFAGLLDGTPGGDTGAPETKNNPIPREWYHTDWVADLTVDWLRSLGADEPWFCWMSFPDPHHPWDPPASELPRVPWQDLDLPPGHPGSEEEIRKVLARKPAHWMGYWDGTFPNMEGGPAAFVPSKLTDDQIREVNAKTHVMNELIDEACGRVLQTVGDRGWLDDTDVVFTTDHGELQGDFGLLFKGPYHTDALMRLPFVWRPAPSAGVVPAVVHDPVGQVDLAPTFCAIAGIDPAPFMQGHALPTADGESGRERALCEWDSQFPGYGMHLRSVYRDGWLCTVYEPSTAGQPNGLEETWGDSVLTPCPVVYDQTETGPGGVGIATGELYHIEDDPYQFENLWESAAHRAQRDDLVADLYASLPGEVRHLKVVAPA